MIADLTLPEIGEDIREARITRILVKVGDRVVVDQLYVEIATDKADMEIPTELSGIIVDVVAVEGQILPVGSVLARIDTPDSSDVAHKLGMTNIAAALRWLGRMDIHDISSRQELGDLAFEEFREFLEETADIAKRFAGFLLETLEEDLEDKLRNALYFVTDLINMMLRYEPRKFGPAKTKEHKRICDRLTTDSGYAIQGLRDVLIAVDRETVAYEASKAYVFISYHHSDAEQARRLTRRLSQKRIAHFLDDSHMSYGPLPQLIQGEIARASHMIVLISSASAKSEWVPFEIGIARMANLIIVPYVLESNIHVPLFITLENRVTEKEGEARLLNDLSRFSRRPRAQDNEPNFETWRPASAKTRILEAEEIWHQSVASYASIVDSSSELGSLVRRGGHLRCILTDPHGTALKSGVFRNIGASARVETLASQFDATKAKLEGIHMQAASGGGVVLKTIDFLPDPIMTIVDPSRDEGVAFVTLNGFGQNPASRPSFLLRKHRDGTWFRFYKDSFAKLWEHRLSREIDLGAPRS